MKKVIKYLSILLLAIAFLFIFDTKTEAIDVQINMANGARIRKDDIIALSFEATVSGINEETLSDDTTFGFEYIKGTYDKDQMTSDLISKTSRTAKLENNIIKTIILIDIEDIDSPYTAIAYVMMGNNKIYSDKVVTRSVTQVASNLGLSEDYTKRVSELANKYYEATVKLNANGGEFSDSTTTKELKLTNPCEFTLPIKAGYRIVGWKDAVTNEIFTSYPGTRKENQTKTYIAIWEEIPTAKTLINQLMPQYIQGDEEIPVEYDGNSLTWTISNNEYISYSNGKISLKKALDHYSHKVNVTLTYSGESATKEVTVNPIELKDLTGTSPFAIYFAIGSLSNYTNYPGHSVNNLFSDKIKEELDIIYYSFAYPQADGTLTMSKGTSYNTIYNQLMELRKNGTRIVLSISGTSSTTCGYFNTICDNDTLRKTFVTNLCNMMEEENFDGIDIDWESASSTNCVVATKLTKLMKDLRTEMNKRSGTGPKYFLSCATPSTSWGAAVDRFDFSKINQYLDYVNMMSYDLNHETNASHVSPLYKSAYDKGYGFSADYGATQFKKLGLSANKIIIGTAAYGKVYKNVSKGTNTTYPGLGQAGTLGVISGVSGSFNSGTIYYSGVLELLKNNNYKQYTEYNAKKQYVGNYLYNETDKIFVAYEGEEMILQKVKYAKDNGYGIMIWSYCEDGSGNLCQVIAENIHKTN